MVHLIYQVVFDESLQRCLDSYLHHAPRSLDFATLPPSPAVADIQRTIHKAVFLTFLRMATHKESKVGAAPLYKKYDIVNCTCESSHQSLFLLLNLLHCAPLSKENFITPAVFGEIIYDNFLFDIPKILDLCVLFGKGNSQLLHKMIGKLFVLLIWKPALYYNRKTCLHLPVHSFSDVFGDLNNF